MPFTIFVHSETGVIFLKFACKGLLCAAAYLKHLIETRLMNPLIYFN